MTPTLGWIGWSCAAALLIVLVLFMRVIFPILRDQAMASKALDETVSNLARARELQRLARDGPWPFTMNDVSINPDVYKTGTSGLPPWRRAK